jgi:hypothetical protein
MSIATGMSRIDRSVQERNVNRHEAHRAPLERHPIQGRKAINIVLLRSTSPLQTSANHFCDRYEEVDGRGFFPLTMII